MLKNFINKVFSLIFHVIFIVGFVSSAKADIPWTNIEGTATLNMYHSGQALDFYYAYDKFIHDDYVKRIVHNGSSLTFENTGDSGAHIHILKQYGRYNIYIGLLSELSTVDSGHTLDGTKLNVDEDIMIFGNNMKGVLYVGVIGKELNNQDYNYFRLASGAKLRVEVMPYPSEEPTDDGTGGSPLVPLSDMDTIKLPDVGLGKIDYGLVKKKCYAGPADNININLTPCAAHPDDQDVATISYKSASGEGQMDVYLRHKHYFHFRPKDEGMPRLKLKRLSDGSCLATPIGQDSFKAVTTHKLESDTEWNDPIQTSPLQTFPNVSQVHFKPYNGDCGYNLTKPDNNYYALPLNFEENLHQAGGVKILVLAPPEDGALPIKINDPLDNELPLTSEPREDEEASESSATSNLTTDTSSTTETSTEVKSISSEVNTSTDTSTTQEETTTTDTKEETSTR